MGILGEIWAALLGYSGIAGVLAGLTWLSRRISTDAKSLITCALVILVAFLSQFHLADFTLRYRVPIEAAKGGFKATIPGQWELVSFALHLIAYQVIAVGLCALAAYGVGSLLRARKTQQSDG